MDTTRMVLVDMTEYDDDSMMAGKMRVMQYPLLYVAEAFGWDAEECEDYRDSIVSGLARAISGVSLSSWLDIHYPEEGKVWRGGQIHE